MIRQQAVGTPQMGWVESCRPEGVPGARVEEMFATGERIDNPTPPSQGRRGGAGATVGRGVVARWVAEATEDAADRGRVSDQGDDAHLGTTRRIQQREHFVDAGEPSRRFDGYAAAAIPTTTHR